MFLKGGIVVSCQSEGNDPFNSVEGVCLFAKAAELGGASAIRSEGVEKTKGILENVEIPVIGLIKSYYDDGFVRITRDIREVESLLEIGVKVVAIDGTNRDSCGFKNGSDLINYIKRRYEGIEVLADISNLKEAKKCIDSGANYVSTTLNGYTPETNKGIKKTPNFKLVRSIIEQTDAFVFAEGRITSVAEIRRFKKLGVYGVVVGTAITRPRIITQQMVNSFNI